ncbi:putative pre-mrna-splicing factor 38b [Golovinomyces cichoracearum]|uniref:Putative pre-mrna-splicing factor 38b n=1 Tax=Golovinomyces cichoracearum TaxID=62708 RepID=A0A420J1K0_9PEZI|nr:putative pre-mrna-splicing factor 38b [Golovinomyces cichoracearum]
MSNYDIFTDDYVAKLLAKDAKESSIRYSAIGLQAYAPSKPPANKPKPNTRFLRNIIKDTDNHNAALLAREAAEARGRLRDLQQSGSQSTGSGKSTSKTIRQNQLGEIEAILGGVSTKRKRYRKITTTSILQPHSSEEIEEHENEQKLRRRNKDKTAVKKCEEKSPIMRNHERTMIGKFNEKSTTVKDRRFKGVMDVLKERERQGDSQKKRHKIRSGSPHETKSRDFDITSGKPSKSIECSYSHILNVDRGPRSKERTGSRTHKSAQSPVSVHENCSDTDPLGEFIGPSPASVHQVRIRGRGNISGTSGIDTRFSAVYDPRTDIQVDSDDEDDWDQAVEVYRDRQKFREKGIERLRAAGFTEEEIRKFERGSNEKREVDVKWTMPGERREWDRGKITDSDGVVGFQAIWGG